MSKIIIYEWWEICGFDVLLGISRVSVYVNSIYTSQLFHTIYKVKFCNPKLISRCPSAIKPTVVFCSYYVETTWKEFTKIMWIILAYVKRKFLTKRGASCDMMNIEIHGPGDFFQILWKEFCIILWNTSEFKYFPRVMGI